MSKLKKSRPPQGISLIGSTGRLGREIKKILPTHFNLKYEIHSKNHKEIFSTEFAKSSVAIDVSLPNVTLSLLKNLLLVNAKLPLVIGCTGWSANEFKFVEKYAKQAPVVFAPNFSCGVNLFFYLMHIAGLHMDSNYSVEIVETHHIHKRDKPSGTAKELAKILEALNPTLRSIRSGTFLGTHEVIFNGVGDRFSFMHEALDRKIFAQGAVKAAQWIVNQKKYGLYSMFDVLGLPRIK